MKLSSKLEIFLELKNQEINGKESDNVKHDDIIEDRHRCIYIHLW
jgi:hypothetical protein